VDLNRNEDMSSGIDVFRTPNAESSSECMQSHNDVQGLNCTAGLSHHSE